jgi:hypothetical protein
MFEEWIRELEPLAARATNKELTAAINAMVADLRQGGRQVGKLSLSLSQACMNPSASSSK